MRRLTPFLTVVAGLAFLAACDNTAPDGGGPDAPFYGAAPTAFVSGSTSLSATLRVTDPGYTPYGGDIPTLEASASGTINVTAPGEATVSLALDRFSSDPMLAATHPSTITSTPDALHFTINGQSRTFPLEPFMQDALMELTEDAGPGPEGTPFRDLPPAQRLQRLQNDGFQVAPLGQGRYKLTRTQTLSDGGTFKTTMTYNSSTGALSDTKLYRDEVLVSESNIAGGLHTAILRQIASGRTFEVEMPLPQ